MQMVLSMIAVQISNSTKAVMDSSRLDELKAAIVFLHDHWPPGDVMRSRAAGIRDAVCASGLISMPLRKAPEHQQIILDCQFLLKYIDKQGPGLWRISN